MLEFISATLIILFAAISPGPDFVLVIKNAIRYDRNASFFTALGIASSLLIHSLYSILGIAIILSKSLFLFNLIKYLGAVYLIYIGLSNLFSKQNRQKSIDEYHTQLLTTKSTRVFLEGLFCNLLNPKAILFTLSFFTLIIKPTTPFALQIGYAIEVALIHLLWFTILGMIMTYHHIKQKIEKVQSVVVRMMGALLISFGTNIFIFT